MIKGIENTDPSSVTFSLKKGKFTCYQTCKRGLNNVSLQEIGVIRKYSVLELLELGKTFK